MMKDHMQEEKKYPIVIVCIVAAACMMWIIHIMRFPSEALTEPADAILETRAFSLEEDEIVLSAVGTCNQHPEYPTGCESTALYILLQYYHVDVTLAEIIDTLPKGPLPYEEDGVYYGPDPEKEFVGDPQSSASFGVFNIPIAQTAQKFREGAVARSGVPLEELKEIVAGGNPVIAWTTIFYDMGTEASAFWIEPETGQEISWISNEHAVVVYGYDEDSIYISDPYSGSKAAVPNEAFSESYSVFGKRIVYYRY